MQKTNKFIIKIKEFFKRKTNRDNEHIIIRNSKQLNSKSSIQPIKINKTEIVSKTDLEDIILKIIKSKNDFIKSKEIIYQLMNNFNKPELAEPVLRYIITKLRTKNHPIIANKNGYKFTTDKQEIESYYSTRICEIEREKGVLNAINK